MRRLFAGLRLLLKRAVGALLFFLEVIGLRRERLVDPDAQITRFKLYHTEFRKLLSSNNTFLETLATLEGHRLGQGYLDGPVLRRLLLRAMVDVHRMVESLIVIAGGRYAELRPVYERIRGELTQVLEAEADAMPRDLVLDLDRVHMGLSTIVGGKMASLGELRGRLGQPTPDGFVASTVAFEHFLSVGSLLPVIQNEHAALSSASQVPAASAAITLRLLSCPIPEALSEALAAAYERLAQRLGHRPRLAVRSSALGEDSFHSFAGQFLTELDVDEKDIAQAYRRVAASLFSEEVMHYRLLHAISGESALMAVGFLPMVPARVSGICFTRDPSRPESGELLIHAVPGLGVSLADGEVSPEELALRREDLVGATAGSAGPIRRTPGLSRTAGPESGTDVGEGPLGPLDHTGLSDEEARRIGQVSLAVEQHFNLPQDIEWALDEQRALRLLQSRPLRIIAQAATADPPVPGYPLLLAGGETACPGAASGPVVHLLADGDLADFPPGAILVAPRSAPTFIRVMDRAQAIVTDRGSTTGHMASLARELRIPALLNTRTATQLLHPGEVVTVDATACRVYQGEVHELTQKQDTPDPSEGAGLGTQAAPALELLSRASPLVIPLRLTDPNAPDFSPAGCRALHDLARFIHEKSYEEMFRMGEQISDVRASSYLLDVFLPIDLYIIDLGGGLVHPIHGSKVKRGQIASWPLRRLLDGMVHPKIPRCGPKPMDAAGFLSIMMRHAMTNPERERTFQDPSYALISENYMNYTARVGYHFSVVDAYCSLTPAKNYVALHFRGGAADRVRRCRRAQAIGGILRARGFSARVNEDLVLGRLSKGSAEETEAALEMLGRLLQFVRQLDVAMVSAEAVALVQQAFFEEDYALERMQRT